MIRPKSSSTSKPKMLNPAVDSQPVPAGQDEVEKALVELREMFPGEVFRVTINQVAEIRETGEPLWRNKTATVLQVSRGLDGFYDASTLADAMQKVREWKEQQDG